MSVGLVRVKIGDETFIIAALMAMRHPKSTVLSGALSALVVMTVGLCVPPRLLQLCWGKKKKLLVLASLTETDPSVPLWCCILRYCLLD